MAPYQTSNSTMTGALSAIAFATCLSASFAPAFADVSYTTRMIEVPHREVPVKLDIYYPVVDGGETVMHGRNAVFQGIELSQGADPLEGEHPVVFFSHGSGGNGVNTGWFLKAIADAGMIAIAPNHPGSTSRDSDPEQSLQTWERPQDISALIDQLPDLLPEGMQGDPERIAAAGFSLGGYSVLSLAGAQISKADFITHCGSNYGKGLNECDWFTRDGFDLANIDRDGFEGDNSDPRIKAVVSIDPGFAAAFTETSIRSIQTPVQIINLGSPGTVYSGVDAAPLVGHFSAVEYHQIEDSWHFSFLGECKWTGSILLAVTFDDPICDNVKNRKRGDVHKEIAQEAVRFLRQHLTPGT